MKLQTLIQDALQNDGGTYIVDMDWFTMPTHATGYYVSHYGIQSHSLDDLSSFIDGHFPTTLHGESGYLGLWLQRPGTWHIDVVYHVESLPVALSMARANGQLSVWDIGNDTVIWVNKAPGQYDPEVVPLSKMVGTSQDDAPRFYSVNVGWIDQANFDPLAHRPQDVSRNSWNAKYADLRSYGPDGKPLLPMDDPKYMSGTEATRTFGYWIVTLLSSDLEELIPNLLRWQYLTVFKSGAWATVQWCHDLPSLSCHYYDVKAQAWGEL